MKKIIASLKARYHKTPHAHRRMEQPNAATVSLKPPEDNQVIGIMSLASSAHWWSGNLDVHLASLPIEVVRMVSSHRIVMLQMSKSDHEMYRVSFCVRMGAVVFVTVLDLSSHRGSSAASTQRMVVLEA